MHRFQSIYIIVKEDLDSNLENDNKTISHYTINRNYQKCILYAITFQKKLIHLFVHILEFVYYIWNAYNFLNTGFVEHSFSKLRIIKKPLRSLITQELLESLSLLNSKADNICYNFSGHFQTIPVKLINPDNH